MSQSERSRAARIRAKATGRNYQKALETVDGEPTSAQRDFEGAFLNRLGFLWYSPSPVKLSTSGIIGVEPLHESLTVHFGEDTDLDDLRDCLLPVLVDDPTAQQPHDVEVTGLPGLRTRAHEAGTSLYRPGIAAEIVLAGIHPGHLEHDTHGVFRYAGRERPHAWTHEETRFVRTYPGAAGLHIESVILRRMGILRAAGARSARSWRSHGATDVVVELDFEEELNREQAEHLRDDFMSKYLEPHLVLDRYEAPRKHARASIEISTPHTGQSVELRLG
ncbi:hypothetical protein [Cryobacterium tagatosivorans]|jgi:hypothetical protein|uniref:Uncharacterized protein n=1 Tax=Cryobacterium tagatosivorans TaxID=1259199 RepID=A0A4R8UIY0_9MICO|nr:hypothetical protein [Cryobacterium tagatosivorans]TFB53634.1 hypothetical protein E3O23_04720 [Cryobacterium tagatosivorans]